MSIEETIEEKRKRWRKKQMEEMAKGPPKTWEQIQQERHDKERWEGVLHFREVIKDKLNYVKIAAETNRKGAEDSLTDEGRKHWDEFEATINKAMVQAEGLASSLKPKDDV